MATYLHLTLDVRIDESIRDQLEDKFPNILYIFPDNVASFHEPAKSSAREGLAAVFRPLWVAGEASFAAAGIPTLSFDPSREFTLAHITEGFSVLADKFNVADFDAVCVPYTVAGEPAFGGGIADPLPSDFMQELKRGLDELQKACDKSMTIKASKLG